MDPIVGVRIKKEMEINRQNVGLLENFLVLNECAYEFTNVKTAEIELELDAALESGRLIQLWFRITMSMFCFTFILACIVSNPDLEARFMN